jgi:hypothetical protein
MSTRRMLFAWAATATLGIAALSTTCAFGGPLQGPGGPVEGPGGPVHVVTPPFLNFTGFACQLGHSTGGGNHNFAITAQSGNFIAVTWQGVNGNPEKAPKQYHGTITEGPFGSYTIRFHWIDGVLDTNTYTGTLTREPDGWYLSGEVVVTNSSGQVVPGMGPGISSCLYIGPGNTIPENGQ